MSLFITTFDGDNPPFPLQPTLITAENEGHQRLIAKNPEFAEWFEANGHRPYYIRGYSEQDGITRVCFEVFKGAE